MIQRRFKIATASSRRSFAWKNQEWTWEKLCEKLSAAKVTGETFAEYTRMKKEDQSSIKDVGGFVGGYLKGGRRLQANLVSRSLVTLDVDFGAGMNAWEAFKMNYACVACMYTTHKHTLAAPRYRIVIPLSRDVTPDEYGALSRFIADMLGIEEFDDSTYEPHRLMYWPSRSTDAPFTFDCWPLVSDWAEYTDADLLDPDIELSEHSNWQDVSTWPVSSRAEAAIRTEARAPGDPREKPNPIGAFCRAYDVPMAIAAFLPDIYTPAGEGRYTYVKGTSACGLTVMDGGLFCYSHHSTDPANGHACNSFDLVRIHRFGHLDADSEDGCPVSKLPSFAAMGGFARQDPAVKQILIDDINKEFAAAVPTPTDVPMEERGQEDEKEPWREKLEVGKNNAAKSTAYNIELIIENDRRLKGAFALNEFTDKVMVFHDLPWRRVIEPGNMRENDEKCLRVYLENKYGIVSREKISDVLAMVCDRHAFHPVRQYLDSLEWDGAHRMDSLLIDYLGAEDTSYVRSVTRKTLLGAVARVRRPGIKFDTVLVLVGGQGIGKSTLVQKLARGWFSDTLSNVQGKEAYEQIQGFWIIELGELAGLKKAELESIKQFLSKSEDSYRAAYAHRVETHKRQCIFIGTTNTYSFLRDPSGNRRFWPVDVERGSHKTVMDDLSKATVDQIWAEAQYVYDHDPEALYLEGKAEDTARVVQEQHCEEDERTGILGEWLDTPIPDGFGDWWQDKRLNYYANTEFSPDETRRRDWASVAEIYCECFHGSIDRRSRQDSESIIAMLTKLGWKRGSSKRMKAYGKQVVFTRPNI